ncbi:aminotransferase class V-fold PLP-dependent enzyme [Acetivibrio straminisolvens]|jgi:cysteine desulfurase family protein|nr:aminotransferase class V-fold PLP-dependent enzyme [Acetivibrio straminisolvens]
MIYLDNAATSYPKPQRVYDEMLFCMKEFCANPGRSGHEMSMRSGRAVYETREIVSRFFNIENPMRVVFTKNATEALNIAINGVLKKGDHVITTSMEHNSVLRPLKTLERNNIIELTIVWGNYFGEIDVTDIERSIKKNTKMIICSLSSNVNGIIMPIKDIGRIAEDNKIIFLVDASQGAGSIRLDVQEIKADMVAIPGHKDLLGPQGVGALYVSEKVEITPIMQGGTGSRSESFYQPEFFPDILESGTLNTPGIVGLGFGIKFIESFGIDNIRIYKHMLIKRLYEGIENLSGIKLYSLKDMEKNSGIISFNFMGMDSAKICVMLDKMYGIASRSGLHCAPLAHETIGTKATGTVRLSVGCFNTIEEIDTTIGALKRISQGL